MSEQPTRKRRSERQKREDRAAESAEERRRQTRRVLPHNLDAEASVLGGVLVYHALHANDPDAIAAFMARIDWLTPDDFYAPQHRFAFLAMRALQARGKPIDVVTVETELETMGKLDAAGGVAFLGELALRVPTPDNVVAYAEVVRDKRLVRQVAERASEIVEMVYTQPDVTDGELITYAGEMIAEINHARPSRRGRFLGEIVLEKAQQLRDVAKRRAETGKEVFVGVPTGLRNFDDLLGGHPYGFPVAICGRSAAGKTSLIQQIADYQAAWLHAEGSKRLVVVCSNEDAEDPFTYRSIAHFGGIDSAAVRRAQINSPEAQAAFESGVAQASQSRIYFMPVHGKTGPEVASEIRRLHAEHGVAVVWLDYLQNMGWPEGARDEQTAFQINVKALIAMQGEIRCALGIGAQLNRDIDDRPWKEGGPVPRKKDIRGSAWLDIAGKVIVGLYHPWAYARPVSWSEEHRLDPRSRKGAELYVTPDYLEGHVLKNSLGREDETFKWSYVRKYARFAPYVETEVQPPLPGQPGPSGAKPSKPNGAGAPARGQTQIPDHPNAPGAE